MRKQRTWKKTELHMGIEPMTFECLTTEPWELIWQARPEVYDLTHPMSSHGSVVHIHCRAFN